MQANKSAIIQAGITLDKIPSELSAIGNVEIRNNVSYDPLGIEIKLNVDEETFKVREISVGEKPIVSVSPELWMWEITPLKAGNHQMVILAVIKLKVPEIDKEYRRDIIVFSEEREVKVNYTYSLAKFTENNWKQVSGLIFGSGSLAWFLKWWFIEKVKKDKSNHDDDDDPQGGVGFARYLER